MSMNLDYSHGPAVLLVDDNLVNQKVARIFLERMGCSVTVAGNGIEAVDACHRQKFALVLMDMQMPVMDGLQATRAIRAADGEGRRTPIVALSANVMPDQVAQCLNAGMDDFLGKPIDLARLREVVALYGAADSSRAVTVTQLPMTAPIDLDHLRKLSDDDAEFTVELVGLFMASSTAILDEIRAAHAKSDRSAVARAAHKLKGASADVCANRMRDVASQLETDSPSMTSEQLERQIGALSSETMRLRKFLCETEMLAA